MKSVNNTTNCIACYQIKCKLCEWIASDEEIVLIQEQKLTACPVCGWIPGNPVSETIL